MALALSTTREVDVEVCAQGSSDEHGNFATTPSGKYSIQSNIYDQQLEHQSSDDSDMEHILHSESCEHEDTLSFSIDSRKEDLSQLRLLSAEEVEEINQEKRAQRHLEGSLFLSRLIRHIGQRESGFRSKAEDVANAVERFVKKMVEQGVGRRYTRYTGKLRKCGSYYEGVKVKQPNEFDYLYELDSDVLNKNTLRMVHQKPQTFKPHKSESIRPRSYYKLFFRDRVPPEWRECCDNKEISVRELQLDFRRKVLEIAEYMEVIREHENCITTQGPAVTLYARFETSNSFQLLFDSHENYSELHGNDIIIKIDISLAIRLVRESDQLWPLDGCDDISLDEEVVQEEGTVDFCHLVMAGDFWRLSFCLHESAHIFSASKEQLGKKHVFQALKFSRDELALTDEYESGLLGTYPLKVTFLKELKNHVMKEDWEMEKLSHRALDILNTLETEGENGTLTSYYLKDDPVLLESDRSYLESRRLKQHFQMLQSSYNMKGLIHTVLFLGNWICMAEIFACSITYIMQIVQLGISFQGSYCREDNSGEKPYLTAFLLQLIPAVIIALLISCMGVAVVHLPRKFLVTKDYTYRMFRLVGGVHTLLLLDELLILLLAVLLIFNFYDQFKCHNDIRRTLGCTALIACFSATICFAFSLYTIIFLVIVRCRPGYYMWEWVFCDELFRQTLRKCFTKGQRYMQATGSSCYSRTMDSATDRVTDCDTQLLIA